MATIPELYGSMVFNDSVMRAKLPKEVYKSLRKTISTGKQIDGSIADTVASAMKEWAIEKGATHYTHWFQPLTTVTAEKHDSFIEPIAGDQVVMELSGKSLVQGEPDASSFPSGGLRATCSARGYTAWDPSSYAFVKDGTLYIPTAFCSYTGESLDYKTPLLRSMEAISEQALRILRIFGDETTKRVTTTVGAEQEYFLINREYYSERDDLLYTGRTLFGAPAPKRQDLKDHYLGPLKPKVAAFMEDLDRELWKFGISSKSKHNEAAPAQHEMAPIYATTNMAVDQNLLTMELMKRVAEKHGLACLLHEKPFAGISGSGKHNNWSLSTDLGKNLLNPGKSPIENTQFLLILAAVVKAVDEYQDLMRLSIASAGNDHRLGACEAPPAIVSMFVGEELSDIIDSIVSDTEYLCGKHAKMDLGIHSIPVFEKDTTDRNRTSPFAFTGNKFEFRMLGSSQNIAMPNVILNTTVAKEFREFADRIEASENKQETIAAVIRETFARHGRIIFNGDSYTQGWETEAERRGLLNLRTSVEAFDVFDAPKNVALFSEFAIFSDTEIEARKYILYENYYKTVRIEARTMIDMAQKQILPAVETYIFSLSKTLRAKLDVLPDAPCRMEKELITRLSLLQDEAYDALNALSREVTAANEEKHAIRAALLYANRIVPAMAALREKVDALESLTAQDAWPLPTYGDMTHRQ
ncbi:MAG: glutamine synthetase III [Clostridia bacterium]|nr:glutamine synthetase III [Clostridia bacterium]MBR2908576.1 glutamine synthetase III [Clostridia bacterium]